MKEENQYLLAGAWVTAVIAAASWWRARRAFRLADPRSRLKVRWVAGPALWLGVVTPLALVFVEPDELLAAFAAWCSLAAFLFGCVLASVFVMPLWAGKWVAAATFVPTVLLAIFADHAAIMSIGKDTSASSMPPGYWYVTDAGPFFCAIVGLSGFIAGSLIAHIGPGVLARFKKDPDGCAGCGYSRAGLVNGAVCPECGIAPNVEA